MNFTFRPYPSHNWLPDWSFEARNCGVSFREMRAGYFFTAGDSTGTLFPQIDQPEWSIHIPLPQNAHINLLFNGFCGYLNHKKKVYAAEVFVVEPGILRGQVNDINLPLLLSNIPIRQEEDFQWIEADSVPALLMTRGNEFCLVTKKRMLEEARALATHWLDQSMDDLVERELRERDGAAQLFEHLRKHDSLAVISAECLMRAIRPAEDRLAHHWSKSPTSDTPRADANELFTLVQAWKHLNPGIAEELVLSTLKLQAPSGAVPVYYSPHETFSILEAPKPLLAKAAEQVFNVTRNQEFLKEIIPLLRRYMQWQLHHFDPKRRGWHFWQNRNECLDPAHFNSEIATVDLTVLLLTEIEALNRLCKASSIHANMEELFITERETLQSNLVKEFWNEEKESFSNAFIRGRVDTIEGIIAFTPTLWPDLPKRQASLILDRLKTTGTLPGGYSILSWRKSALDRNKSFPLLHQVIALEGLKTSDPNGTVSKDFARLILEGFIEWHSTEVEQGRIGVDAITAAYIIDLVETRGYRAKPKSKTSEFFYNLKRKTKADRNDLWIIGTALLLAFGIHIIYEKGRKAPPREHLKSMMQHAYKTMDAPQLVTHCAMMIEHYPDHAALAHLYAANLLIATRDWPGAEKHLRTLREAAPDSPAGMISLGLVLQQQGKFAEADPHYEEFELLFENIFPELVLEVRNWRYLLREEFTSPPKWESIYDTYKLMHELGE
jgi:tetratricopeptide (TPR) repeat protein